jgi:glycerol-3-phosphate dehydrogenase
MAKDLMDKVVDVMGLEDSKGCQTDGYMLEGGEGWYPTLFIRLVQDYGLDIDVRNNVTIRIIIME